VAEEIGCMFLGGAKRRTNRYSGNNPGGRSLWKTRPSRFRDIWSHKIAWKEGGPTRRRTRFMRGHEYLPNLVRAEWGERMEKGLCEKTRQTPIGKVEDNPVKPTSRSDHGGQCRIVMKV